MGRLLKEFKEELLSGSGDEQDWKWKYNVKLESSTEQHRVPGTGLVIVSLNVY